MSETLVLYEALRKCFPEMALPQEPLCPCCLTKLTRGHTIALRFGEVATVRLHPGCRQAALKRLAREGLRPMGEDDQ